MERKTSTDGKWVYHDVPYLIQHVPSGTFYVRKRVGNKIVQRSLNTKYISDAKARLPAKIVEIDAEFAVRMDRDLPRPPVGYKPEDPVLATLPSSKNFDPNRATKWDEAAAIWLDQVLSDPAISPNTKRLRTVAVRYLRERWTDLGARRLRDLTAEACRDFFVDLAKRYSPSYYNMLRWTFREIVKLQRERDATLGLELLPDPTLKIRRLGVRYKEFLLPSQEEFNAVLTYLDREAPRAAFVTRLAAYTGVRWSEARQLRWGDVDFRQKQIKVWCAKRRKSGGHPVYRYVPMIPDAQKFFGYWVEALKPFPQDLIVASKTRAWDTLHRACKAAGAPPMRFHDLRHYFATRCIEAGVDIPTVSRWLGHLDGGVLALKVYGHLRREHSQLQAARVGLQETHEYGIDGSGAHSYGPPLVGDCSPDEEGAGGVPQAGTGR